MFFSIAISAYKGKYLKEAIESILSQTYKDFELIILNDCSPESIGSIISKFDDTRLQYFENKVNIGAEHLVNNWNNCLSKAKGEYFIMMGDDDLMDAIYLEEFTRLIAKYPELDVYHCRSIIIDENSIPLKLTPSWPEYETVYENIWHRIAGHRLQFISDFVYRTNALKMKGGFFYLPLAWGSDDITSYIASIEQGIAHTNKPVFYYRQTAYTISSAIVNYKKKIEAVILQQQWMENFLKDKPESNIDRIIYFDLKRQVKIWSKSQRLYLITKSLRLNSFKILLNNIKYYKKNKVTLFDLGVCFIKSRKAK